jgi:hypothetical protein
MLAGQENGSGEAGPVQHQVILKHDAADAIAV